jgi:hypothetical protein
MELPASSKMGAPIREVASIVRDPVPTIMPFDRRNRVASGRLPGDLAAVCGAAAIQHGGQR